MFWWIAGGAITATVLGYIIIAVTQYNNLVVCKNRSEVIEERAKLPHFWDNKRDELRKARAWIDTNAKDVWIDSYDGLRLHGYLIYADEPTSSTVIAVHGHQSNAINEFGLYVDFYREHNVNILMVDLRGHGKSGGKYITFGYKDRYDCVRWCKKACEIFGDDSKIMLHGISMGGATVVMTAAERPKNLVGVISDCAFSDTWDIFAYVMKHHHKAGKFPVLYLMNLMNRFQNGFSYRKCSAKKQIEHADVPFLFIHGDMDRYVPVEMAHELYEACPCEKTIYIAEGATHGTSFFVQERDVKNEIVAFMRRINFST